MTYSRTNPLPIAGKVLSLGSMKAELRADGAAASQQTSSLSPKYLAECPSVVKDLTHEYIHTMADRLHAYVQYHRMAVEVRYLPLLSLGREPTELYGSEGDCSAYATSPQGGVVRGDERIVCLDGKGRSGYRKVVTPNLTQDS